MKKKLLTALMLILLTIGLFATFALSADVPMMTKEEHKAMIGNPDLVIFDVRLGSDYFSSDLKIKGTGRFEGIKGTITAKDKRLTPLSPGLKEMRGDAVVDGTMTYTLPPK